MAAPRRRRRPGARRRDAAAADVPQGDGAQEAQGARRRRRDSRAQHHRDDGHDDHHPGVPPQVLRRLGHLADPVARTSSRRSRAPAPLPKDTVAVTITPRDILVGDRVVVELENGQIPPALLNGRLVMPLDQALRQGSGEAEVHRRRATRTRRSATSCRSSVTSASPTTCSSPSSTPPARTSWRTTASWCSRRARRPKGSYRPAARASRLTATGVGRCPGADLSRSSSSS